MVVGVVDMATPVVHGPSHRAGRARARRTQAVWRSELPSGERRTRGRPARSLSQRGVVDFSAGRRCGFELPVLGAFQPVLADLGVEGHAVDVEDACGLASRCPPVCLRIARDVPALDLLERGRVLCRPVAPRREVQAEVLGPRAPARRETTIAALEDVPQLAHVAGPVVGQEDAPSPRARRPRRAASARPRAARGGAVDEERDVLLALAQRRERDRDDVQPVEEVLPERPSLDRASAGRGSSRR